MAHDERSPARRGGWFRAKLAGFWPGLAYFWMIASGWLALSVLAVTVPELIFGPDREGALYLSLTMAVMAGTGWLAARPWRKPAPLPGQVPAETLTRKLATPGIWVAKKQHRLPRPGSSARQPMRQLNEAEYALAELLRRLGDSVLTEPAAEDTWRSATDTAAQLRSVATRLEAVELAVAHAPRPEAAALEQGAAELRARIDQGLDAYRDLIPAAGRVLLASAPSPNIDELVEATERLAGLAEALAELATSTQLAGAERETRGGRTRDSRGAGE